ncbi:AAA family ATPase [Streptomyces sp. HPF1205]|uniref:AAA family ATPase n=1 Tax=Streptomyces sp. HPF1205 TaxID=2873262 RepID=UPI001CEDB875|nr:AAA family ATPase [Streptomyces sp. HPF1205]
MTTPAQLPVLWICGPSGVGKSTVGWEFHRRLARAGIASGFVDIDQLGICYPEPAADPGRHRMQADNLGAMVAGFSDAGARCLVVTGVVDAGRGVYADRMPGVALMVCRLRADPETVGLRFLGRGSPAGLVEEVLRDAAALDTSDFADTCVDTEGLPVAEVVRLVGERTGGWPGPGGLRPVRLPSPAAPVPAPVPPPAHPVLWVCGATGVGKSAVGFEVYQRLLGDGETAAYVDVEQLGLCDPAPAGDPGRHRLRARGLAALWATYHRAAGARRLVVTGPLEDEGDLSAYAEALPGARFTVCRLHAGPRELAARIARRGRGEGWNQPGDPLRGRPAARLREIAGRAAASAAAMEAADLGDLRVDTDGRTVAEAADAVLAGAGARIP